MATPEPCKYRAFLSYSHRDTAAAKRLHGRLEGFRIDKDPVGRETPMGPIPKHLRPIFRDRHDFDAGGTLAAQTIAALDSSAALILVASPAAATSKLVNEEIRLYASRHRDRPVIPVIVDGVSGDAEKECFPPALCPENGSADGVLAADERDSGDGRELALAKVIARVIGLTPDEVFRRAERERRRKLRLRNAIIGVLAVLAVAATASAFYAWQQRAVAEAQKKEAQLQRDKARSQLLAIQARQAAESVDPDDIERASALALESIAIARKNKRPAEADAVEAARSALIHLPLAVLLQGSGVGSLAALGDGRLASGGEDGKIRIWRKDLAGPPEVLPQGSGVDSLAVLKDGRLARGGGDGKIRIWPKDFAGAPKVLSQGGVVESLAVVGDGRLASGGEDGKIRIWPKDFAGPPEVLRQGSPVESLAVLKDGRLASGGEDGRIRIWLVDAQELVATLCLRAGRNLTKDEWAQYIGSDILWQPSCRDLPSNWRTPD